MAFEPNTIQEAARNAFRFNDGMASNRRAAQRREGEKIAWATLLEWLEQVNSTI